ncbi:hypothetical protein LV75_001707 [Actinokineospora diospyrosa]|uniref:Uncharacterized protein n=2 Tax=Actinokineospora diospyrosa TaxID=103728 RepID=A0ABT1I9A6_9PSEU|nr:hypothetical protein [Actinokineospora diospyrosa]
MKLKGSQWTALTNVHHNATDDNDPNNGKLTTTDQRVIGPMIRHGWVEERQTRRGRRIRRSWWITDAGRRALAELPLDRYQAPMWRQWWNIRRAAHGAWVVDEHELIKAGRDYVRVLCPLRGPDRSIATETTLFDAVEALDLHFQALPRPLCIPTNPAPEPSPVGEPVDLDDITDGGGWHL